jgi:hypothetical protein
MAWRGEAGMAWRGKTWQGNAGQGSLMKKNSAWQFVRYFFIYWFIFIICQLGFAFCKPL